jgi:hypothetical protein
MISNASGKRQAWVCVTAGGDVGDNLLRLDYLASNGDGCTTAKFLKSRSEDRPLHSMMSKKVETNDGENIGWGEDSGCDVWGVEG